MPTRSFTRKKLIWHQLSSLIKNFVAYSFIFATLAPSSQGAPNKAEIDNYARANGFPRSDYPYYENANGCGGEGWSETAVRDTWGKVSFREACNNHDRCYMTQGSDVNVCDNKFGFELRVSCERDSYVRDPILNTRIPDPVTLSACYPIATSYFGAVRAVGWNWHQGSQAKARRYNNLVVTFVPQTVIGIYNDILERGVDPSGMETWSRELNNGSTILQVRRAIAESPEAQGKLNDLYRRILGRDIDLSGRATWTNALASGWSLQRVANEGISPSTENRTQVVKKIYREILEREVDSSGMDTWTRELNSGKSMLQVRRLIVESQEAQTKLDSLYLTMLCRGIDPSGRSTWSNALSSGWTMEQVASQGIAPSQEYQSRGGRPCN